MSQAAGDYQAIVESAVDFAIVATDRQGLVTHWNSGAERVLGWSSDEMLGKPVDRFFTPEDREAGRPATEMNLALVNGRAADERWHLRRDGSRFWASGEMMPLRDEEGVHLGFVKILRDRTAEHEAGQTLSKAEASLRQAQAELAADRDLLAQMFEQAPTFLAILRGPEHRVERVNPGYVRLIGGRAVVGRTVAEALPDAVAQGFPGILDGVFQSGEPFAATAMQYAVQAQADGTVSECYVDFTYQPLKDASGSVFGILVEGVDVTERVRAERTRTVLAQLSDRLRDAAEPTDMAFAAAEVLGTALGASRVGYATVDHDAEALHVERDWTAPGAGTLAGVIRMSDYGSFVEDMKRGEVIAIADVRQDKRTAMAADAVEGLQVRSFVNVPVIEQGRLVAALLVNHAEPHDWTLEELGLIREVAERTHTAVERARAAAALRQSEQRYRTLFEAIDAGFCMIEVREAPAAQVDYRVVEANAAFYRQTGFPETILGRWLREAAPALEEHWFETYGRVARTGEPTRFEQGSAALGRWFDVYAFRAGGLEDGSVGVLFNDISARRAAEERLRELNETLESEVASRTAERDRIWQVSRDMLGVADEQGVWLSINPAWTRIVGWSAAEIVGRTSEWMEHPEDRAKTRAEVSRLAEGQETLAFENRFRTKDGTYRDLSWTAVPERGHLYTVARDVTEEKARTAELAQAQEALRQAQKMEAVGQLTGGLAHDFNNLLAGISGSLELMDKRIAQGRFGEVERYVAAAQGAAKRAAALTHRLLAFSRRQTLEPKATDVNRLAADMEELIRRTVGPAIELETDLQAGLWSTLVDPYQLENALLNLCINARDALPDGGRITVETANASLDRRVARLRDLPPGQYVSLCVTDNGTGMTSDVIERAFEPFFTTKPLGEGTGLGLSMIYGFARQSGGQVRIHSQVGQGTTVCLYLPRHDGQEATEATGGTVQVEARSVGAGERVLVIDDEPTVRMLVVDLVEEMGFQAIEADTGPEGLNVLRSAVRIDLLVTDVGLPGGLNGRQVADAARVLRPDLPVLFITGYAETAVLSHGHLAPGMQVVTKPFDMDKLASRIREMITSRSRVTHPEA